MDLEKIIEEEGNAFLGLSFEGNLGVWMLHWDCKQWSPSTFKRYKKKWEEAKVELRKRSIFECFGLAEDPKAVKLNRMFGATWTGHVVKDEDGVLNYLLRVEV